MSAKNFGRIQHVVLGLLVVAGVGNILIATLSVMGII